MRNEALELPRDTGHNWYSIDGMQIHQKKLNTQLTKNVIMLSQLVGFKAKVVDEEGVWCACTVEEISNDRLHDHFV